jgi:hypothetical protein
MSTDYSKEWQDLKTRRAVFLFIFVGWMFFGTALKPLISHIIGSEISESILFLIYSPVFIFAGFRLINFKCPRCKDRYSSINWVFGSKKCLSCGLKKWSAGN